MKVILKKISLTNFKGFAKAEKMFNGQVETISAENGQGKTTLRDAWFWLLGFNVSDIIPSHDNKEIPNLEIKVEAEVSIDDATYIFTREQKEVRKTNKDTGIDEKLNNESTYLIDGIPFTLRNYKDKLSDLLSISYDKLQMLCQKEYFNTDNGDKWKWTNRRKELFDICHVDDVLSDMVNKECYNLIAEAIHKKTSTTEIKKAIKRELAGYASDKEKNLVLIADKQNEIAKFGEYDFAALEEEKAALESQISQILVGNSKQVENEELVGLQKQKTEITMQIIHLQGEQAKQRAEIENKLSFAVDELKKVQSRAETLKADMASAKATIETLENNNDVLTADEWKGELVCPTCRQALPAESIEESKKRYEEDKAKRIAINTQNIDSRVDFLKTAKKQLEEFRETYTVLNSQKKTYEVELNAVSEDCTIKSLNDKLVEVTASIDCLSKNESNKNDASSLVEPLRRRVSEINTLLGYKKIMSDFAERVEQLKAQNRDITDKEMLAKTKVKQLDEYVREQVRLVTDIINSKFKNGVSFSLFNELYAGSEHEIKEECICMLNGKTYSEMSYGERYLADLEVTKALQAEYSVNLPIFLDNAECFTGDVQAEQQLILLYAKKGAFLDGIKIDVIL